MKSAMDERYARLYEDLFKDGLAYAEGATCSSAGNLSGY